MVLWCGGCGTHGSEESRKSWWHMKIKVVACEQLTSGGFRFVLPILNFYFRVNVPLLLIRIIFSPFKQTAYRNGNKSSSGWVFLYPILTASLLLWPKPSPFNKRVFFHPKPTSSGPRGLVPSCLAQPNPKSETQIWIYDFLAKNHKHKHKHKSKHNHKHKHKNHKN